MASSRPAAALDTPEELIRRAAQGDVAAFARIIRLHHEEMTQVGFLVVGDVAGAAAAVGAALPVAWRRLGRAPAAERLGPWLCSLAAGEAVVLARSALAPGGAGPITPLAPTGPLAPIAPIAPGVPAPDGAAVAPLVPAGQPVDAGLEPALAGLDAQDRALLALRHVAGMSVAELAGVTRRSRPPVQERLERLAAALEGLAPPGLGADPAPGRRLSPNGFDATAIEAALGSRLRAYASVPVRPIDADAAARLARAEDVLERRRVVSVALSAVAGAIVLAAPYLAALAFRR